MTVDWYTVLGFVFINTGVGFAIGYIKGARDERTRWSRR